MNGGYSGATTPDLHRLPYQVRSGGLPLGYGNVVKAAPIRAVRRHNKSPANPLSIANGGLAGANLN